MEKLHAAQELDRGVYWLGMRRNVRLESNSYVRVFQKKGMNLGLLIDPGGPHIFPAILKRLQSILGDLRRLWLVFLSYQETGASINLAYQQNTNPALTVICAEDVWRMAHALGLSKLRFQAVETLSKSRVRLAQDLCLRFIPTPYCPSHGACMLYDEQRRILFSGGLFGGITFTLSLFATHQHWEGIRIWHQMYIPDKRALHQAIEAVRQLDPPPKIIAPQHGGLLQDEMIPFVLEKLSSLPVGLDLPRATEIDKVMYIEAINEVLDSIAETAGQKVLTHLLHRLDQDLSFPRLFTVKEGRLIDIRDEVLGDVLGAFKMLLYAIIQDQPKEIQEMARAAILKSNWNMPLFMQTFVHRKS